MTYTRSQDEIGQAWAVQLGFLASSVQAFDAGDRHEACRIAAAVHLLVGRGQRQHRSICDSLGVQDTRHYRSSVATGAQGLPLIVCQVECVIDGEWIIDLKSMGSRAVADGHDLAFDEWWSQTVIDTQGHQLNRRDVVMILRDKNGGAHFDTTINNPLIAAALRGELSFQYQPRAGEPTQPVVFSLETCMRQIAEELLFSFRSPDSKMTYANEAEGPSLASRSLEGAPPP
jgi:hypothetical protein